GRLPPARHGEGVGSYATLFFAPGELLQDAEEPTADVDEVMVMPVALKPFAPLAAAVARRAPQVRDVGEDGGAGAQNGRGVQRPAGETEPTQPLENAQDFLAPVRGSGALAPDGFGRQEVGKAKQGRALTQDLLVNEPEQPLRGGAQAHPRDDPVQLLPVPPG